MDGTLQRVRAPCVPVVELPTGRLNLDLRNGPRRAYAEAKATLAVVVAPRSCRTG